MSANITQGKQRRYDCTRTVTDLASRRQRLRRHRHRPGRPNRMERLVLVHLCCNLRNIHHRQSRYVLPSLLIQACG